MLEHVIPSRWKFYGVRSQPEGHSKRVYKAGEMLFNDIYKVKIYLTEKDQYDYLARSLTF